MRSGTAQCDMIRIMKVDREHRAGDMGSGRELLVGW